MLAALRQLAARNRARTSLIGMGYHGTVTPPVIQRNVLEDPAWYTAYTPYQAEISQGRLEALLNFQTMVSELTGLPMANASLLDEATAAAEAMAMARRLARTDSARFVVHHDTHPQTIAVLATRAEPIGVDLVVGDVDARRRWLLRCAVQPADLDRRDRRLDGGHRAGPRRRRAGDRGHATRWPACCSLPRVELGADIAVGSSQRFGVPMGYGGPHAAFIAAHEHAARAFPGRLVGVSTDTAGRPALRMALQTREQHIRREKATSNICTAQVLLANIAGFYAAWHGPEGLRRIAERVHRLTVDRRRGAAPRRPAAAPRHVVRHADRRRRRCRGRAGRGTGRRASTCAGVGDDAVGLTFDETSTLDVVRRAVARRSASTAARRRRARRGIPAAARRTGELLPQAVFHRYHTEHEMLRYLRRLADRDLALDRTMIPLGLVHDEAQRDHGDGADHVARVRRPAPLRPRRRRRRAARS